MNQPRTAAATAAVIRRGQETKATKLRQAGWLVVPPEVVAQLPDAVIERINNAITQYEPRH